MSRSSILAILLIIGTPQPEPPAIMILRAFQNSRLQRKRMLWMWLVAALSLMAVFPPSLLSAPVGEKVRLADGTLYQGDYRVTTYAPGTDQFLETRGAWEALVSGADVKITVENERNGKKRVISLIGEDQFSLVTRKDSGFEEGEIRRRVPETVTGEDARTAQFIFHRLRQIKATGSTMPPTYALAWSHLTETVDAAIPTGVSVRRKTTEAGLVDQWYVNAWRTDRADGSVGSHPVRRYPPIGFLALEYPVQDGPLKPGEPMLIKEFLPKSSPPDHLRAEDDVYLFRETTITFQGQRAATNMNLFPTVTFHPVFVRDYRFRSDADDEPETFGFEETYWVTSDNRIGSSLLRAIAMEDALVEKGIRTGIIMLLIIGSAGFLVFFLAFRKRKSEVE